MPLDLFEATPSFVLQFDPFAKSSSQEVDIA